MTKAPHVKELEFMPYFPSIGDRAPGLAQLEKNLQEHRDTRIKAALWLNRVMSDPKAMSAYLKSLANSDDLGDRLASVIFNGR